MNSTPHLAMEMYEDNVQTECETQCWGCGLHLVLPYFSAAFRCSWCGAITFSKPPPPKNTKWVKLAVFRDKALVTIVFLIISGVTGGGLWTVYPILFPQATWIGHSQILFTIFLAFSTLYTYCLAAFIPAGSPRNIPFGSVEYISKSSLDGYTYCFHCACPKPPHAHHCRTCETCIMDMDHHCPFIGNCVGTNNHRHFVLFLVYTLISSSYILFMSVLAGMRVWPLILDMYGVRGRGIFASTGTILAASFLDAFEEHSGLSLRSLGLIYLIITALSLLIGLTLLLRQQLQLLYEGHTYIDSIKGGDEEFSKRGWHNLRRLFGKRHPLVWLFPKIHSK